MKKFATIVAVFLALSGFARADLLLAWDFGSSTTAPASSNAYFAADLMLTTAVSRGSGLTAVNNNGRFNAQSWTMPSTALPGSAITSNDYFTFTVAADTGNLFSLTNLNMNIQRSNTGASNLFVRASYDSFATDLFSATSIAGNDTTVPISIALSGFSGLQNTTAIEFRVYGYAASASAGSMGFEGAGNDIAVFGTVVVPEPGTASLIILGLGSLVYARRRLQ